MRDGYDTNPINQLPAVVWLLALPVVAMEIVLFLGQRGLAGGAEAVGWRLDALQRFAFSPGALRAMWEAGYWPPQEAMRFVTYPFVHGGLTQALFAGVIILALGKFVGEVFRPWALILVFFASAIAGALAYAAIPGVTAALFGAFPAAYGLIGAFTFILWARLGASGDNRYRAFSMIGILMGVQIAFGLFYGGLEWVADLAGFATGFALSFVVSPGGWQAAVARMRRR